MAVSAAKFQSVTGFQGPVTAEVASSSLVVPASFFNKIQVFHQDPNSNLGPIRNPTLPTDKFPCNLRLEPLHCATDRAESADADIEMARRKAFPAILRLPDRSYRKPIEQVQWKA